MTSSKNPLFSKTAVLYRRVSTEEQAKTGFSLAHQEDQLHKECRRRNFHIAAEFNDDGYSATSLQRPGLQNLINYLKKNKNQIDYLVVTKWCRLSRDVKNTILLVNELVEYGVKVFTLEEGDISDEPSAFFMRYLNMVLPEIDNRMRAKNTKAGIFRALKEGYFPYGTPPRGYSKDHNTPKTPLLVPNEEAEIIREAFELFATDHLSIEDVRRATAKRGVSIGKSQFSLMLRNPVYVGKILVPESKENPGHLINGMHQGIVSEETFWKVQKILINRQKKKVYTTIKQKIREEFPLRGFLVCPACGHNWTGSVSKGNGGQYAYYHCQKECSVSVNAVVANDAFLAYLKTLVPPEEVVLLYQKLLKEMVTKIECRESKRVSLVCINN